MNWNLLTNSTANPSLIACLNTADGTPASRHTYLGMAYLAHTDRMFASGGSRPGDGNAGCNQAWVFDFVANRWINQNPSGSVPPTGYENASAYDPLTGRVWWGDEGLSYWLRFRPGTLFLPLRHQLLDDVHGENRQDFLLEEFGPAFSSRLRRRGPKRAKGSNISRVLWSLAKNTGPPERADITWEFSTEAPGKSRGKSLFREFFSWVMKMRGFLRVHQY